MVLYSSKQGAGASHPGMRAAGVLDSAKPAGMESKVRYIDKPDTVLSIWGAAHGVNYLHQLTHSRSKPRSKVTRSTKKQGMRMREQTGERNVDESDGKWAGLQDSPRQQPVEYSSSPSQPSTLKARDRFPLMWSY